MFDLFGNDAADAALEAAKKTGAAGRRSYGEYGKLAGRFDPYSQAGESALSRLMSGLGLGGDPAAFTAAYRALPGYQSGLESGTTAALRAQNAGPGSLGGSRAGRNMYRFGSDYEDQRAGEYLGRLGGVTNMGLGATGQATGLQGRGIDARFDAEKQEALGGVAAAQAKQSALQNLMGMAAQLGGTFLGGPMAGNMAKGMFGGGMGGGMGLPKGFGGSTLY